MKLVKFAPALAATLVLAACSSEPVVVKSTSGQEAVSQASSQATQQVNNVGSAAHGTAAVKVEKATDGSKTVVYRCQSGKQVTATYAFQGEEAKAVNLALGKGKKVQALPTLTRDTANKDFTSFASDKYVWNVENGFSLSTATKETTGMLTEKGGETDKILAKLCDVNSRLTAKANK